MPSKTCALALAGLFAATAVAIAPATAQGAAAVAGCSVVSDPAERIACLEAALLAEEGGAPAAPPPAVAPTAPPIEAPAEAPAQPPVASPAATATSADAAAAPVATPEERGRRRLPSLPFLGGRDQADEPDAAAPVFASDAPEAAEMGAEQLAARGVGDSAPARERAPRMAASVVSARVVPYKRLQVELDNGQVWRQIESDSPWDDARYDAPSQVEIWPSRFGGYRMRIAEQDLRLRVERVR